MALAGLDFPLLVARDAADYVAVAARLAARPERIADARRRLARRLRVGALFDTDRWVAARTAPRPPGDADRHLWRRAEAAARFLGRASSCVTPSVCGKRLTAETPAGGWV